MTPVVSRRGALAGMALAAGAPAFLGDLCYGARAPERRRMGLIGAGGQGYHLLSKAVELTEFVAVADVDAEHAARAAAIREGTRAYDDYRRLLDRPDVDLVLIAVPDHWHARIAIDAMRAGKDVYLEKPLALTVAEGQQLVRLQRATGRVVQIGTQQRSEYQLNFLRAVATVRSGQIGKLLRTTVALPLTTQTGGPFASKQPPPGLNWDFWQGQAPARPYAPERCHHDFRWWYEYSGGIVTDWGAHHLDIAQWAMDLEHSGPVAIDGRATRMPAIPGGYSTPREPHIAYRYPGGMSLELTTRTLGEMIRFEGTDGRIEVSRSRLEGEAIRRQAADASLAEQTHRWMARLYGDRKPGSHLRNFLECVAARQAPVSEIVGQHRSATACHLGNIACRLAAALEWKPELETFVGAEAAQAMLSREQRLPYRVGDA